MAIKLFTGTLYQRVAAIFVLSLFAIAAGEFLLLRRLYFSTHSAVEHHLKHDLAYRYAEALQPVMKFGVRDFRFAKELRRLARLNPQSEVAIIDRQGRLLPVGDRDEHGNPLPFEMRPAWLDETIDDKDEVVSLEPIERFLNHEFNRTTPVMGRFPASRPQLYPISAAPFTTPYESGYIYIALLGAEWFGASRRQMESELVVTGIYSGGIGLAVLFAISGTLLYLVTLRFRKIVGTVNALRLGALKARTNLEGDDEIAQLGQGIDEMAAAIEGNIEVIEQRDKLRRELVANVYHDFGGPLANVRSYLDRLAKEHRQMDNEALQNHVDIALSNTNLLLRMSRELLELSKLESNEIKPERSEFDISELLEMEIVPRLLPLAGEQQVELAVEAPEGGAVVSADLHMIERVLGNLIENAVRYNKRGGKVVVQVQHGNGEVGISVSDTGAGIPEGELPKIFNRFFRLRTDKKGTGLGLAIVKEMLRAHEKEISVQSILDQGTTFSFSLPRGGTEK